jgi:hypothetical protein
MPIIIPQYIYTAAIIGDAKYLHQDHSWPRLEMIDKVERLQTGSNQGASDR